MKNVLAIMGSARKMKNTDTLLDNVLKVFKDKDVEIKKVYLKDLNISLCTACNYCGKTGKCAINDDMKQLYDSFNNSDGIIVASPLYFNTVSSLTKIMIDRCQMYWGSKYQLKNSSIDRNKKRIGMFLCVGGSPYKKDQFNACIPVMDLFFKAINANYKYNFFVSNTDKEKICDREDILKKAYEVANEFFNDL
ncbi:flavodoxin family protein [Haloimpatiens sp. FM7330]|uniref:flavodoxin family protein n=1 Tax=Haloimpatiens sp. FM7330 TaxID=3298610 RepID=UPI003645E84B